MLKTAILATLGLSGLCAIALCAQTTNVSKSDAAFLREAAEADMTTANLGQTAQDRAANTQIKDFGRKLTTDHTNDYRQVSELATKTGEAIPKAIDTQDNREINTLDRANGKTFDHEFLTHEVAMHQRLIRAAKQEAEHGTNPDIKAYANKVLATMEEHLHDAQDLLSNSRKTVAVSSARPKA